jgi:hypothetical protein
MRPNLVPTETLASFFASLVDDAITHQRLRPHDLTRYYLVQLLASRARLDHDSEGESRESEPLALWLARALETGGSRRQTELRRLADHALFIAGFFSESLTREVVDVDYYASLGGHAYQHLSAIGSDTFAPAYAELGRRFLAFADVLSEVSEQSGLTSDTDLLRLYERWVHHGSRRNTEKLVRRGLTPSVQARLARHRLQ